MVSSYHQVLGGDNFKELFERATFAYTDYDRFFKFVTAKWTTVPRTRTAANNFLTAGIKPGMLAPVIQAERVLVGHLAALPEKD